MDRVISLLAALVGLIALGGAILVHTNADTQRREMATEIAALKTSISLLGGPAPAGSKAPIPELTPVTPVSTASMPSAAPASIPSAEPPSSSSAAASSASSAEAPESAKAMEDLQARIASLEAQTKEQASELDAARAQLASASSVPPPTQVATADPEASTGPSSVSSSQPAATPAAVVANGPTKDCIPLGTRFMGQSGDSFPICKTRMVLKVAAVTDGLATINGAGDVAAGATVPYDKGCTLSVFSADPSGYAEMRVTCQ